MSIKLTNIRYRSVPRIIHTYEDQYEAVIIVQAQFAHKSKKGNDVTHYVYYYPDSYHSYRVPIYFLTHEDIFDKLCQAHPVEGYVERIIEKYAQKKWALYDWDEDEKWYDAFKQLADISFDYKRANQETVYI